MKARLYRWLTLLTPTELQAFSLLLQAENPRLGRLVEVYARALHAALSTEPDPRTCWAQAYPEKTYTGKLWSIYTTECLRHIRLFLTYRWLSRPENEHRVQLALIEGLLDRNAVDLAGQELQTTTEKLALAPLPDDQQLWFKAEMARLHDVILERQADRSRQGTHLHEQLHWLEAYTRLTRAQLSLQALNRGQVLATTSATQGTLPTVQTTAELYEQMAELVANPENLALGHTLQARLQASATEPGTAARRELYNYLLNHAIGRLNRGAIDEMPRIQALYIDMMTQGVLTNEHGQLTPAHFKNIVTIGLRLGAFDWVEQFMKDYAYALPEEQRTPTIAYNQANIHFYRGQYASALKLLARVEVEDIFFILDKKSLQMKIYFLQRDERAFTSHLPAFETLLRRDKKISAYQKEVYLNLIRFTRQLFKFYLGERVSLARLGEEIDATPTIADKTWLKRQLTEALALEQGNNNNRHKGKNKS
jgi:hypothetical protein